MDNIYRKTGALPSQTILQMIHSGFIKNAKEGNVKPASLDLTLSGEMYEVEGMFQPKNKETVREVLNLVKKKKHSIDRPLLKDRIYVVRLNETLQLPKTVYAYCNPKSSSGRLDIHVRLIVDGVARYDSITPSGWKGEMWVSVVPKTFPVRLYEGVSLNQLRFFNMDTRMNEFEMEIAFKKHHMLWNTKNHKPYSYDEIKIRDNDGSLILTLDIEGEICGYVGKVSNEIVDLKNVNFYSSEKFFTKLKKKGDFLYLKKDHFYILSTKEAVRVSPNLACEMVSMDERSGEFRSHYAGFIDPGWGWGVKGEGKGRPLTLEVRPFEDIIIRHGQPIGKIRFEYLLEEPEYTYDTLPSNYLLQTGPKLSKNFKTK